MGSQVSPTCQGRVVYPIFDDRTGPCGAVAHMYKFNGAITAFCVGCSKPYCKHWNEIIGITVPEILASKLREEAIAYSVRIKKEAIASSIMDF